MATKKANHGRWEQNHPSIDRVSAGPQGERHADNLWADATDSHKALSGNGGKRHRTAQPTTSFKTEQKVPDSGKPIRGLYRRVGMLSPL